jgi:hypothetical protein
MATRTSSHIVGAFSDQQHAVRAVHDLRKAGFADENLGLVAREWVADAPPPVDVKVQHRGGNAAVGGAAAGAAVGAAAVLGLSLVPGLGLLAAGGLLISALGGAALGAAVGTFAAPFLALEMSEAEARQHARHVEAGRTVVIVRTAERQKEAQEILIRNGAYDERMDPTPA